MERNSINPAVAGPALVEAPELKLEVHAAAEWPRLAPVWAELYRRSGSRSFFLNEEWTATWLETFAPPLNVSILVFADANGPTGICLLTESRRYAALGIRRLSLNASGEAASESTYIEHNDILCRPGSQAPVARALARYVLSLRWDEFALDGMQDGPIYNALTQALSGIHCDQESKLSYYVDLQALRQRGVSIEAALRSRYRINLHRCIREYEKLGPLRLERAADCTQALEMLEELSSLSRRRLASRRNTSTFDAPRFREFNRRLVARCFANGAVEMLRLTAGSQVVGILYDLIQAGKVHEYQCGCRYSGPGYMNPGALTHAYGIQYCLDGGLDEWDFLAGDAISKRSFAGGSRNLFWAVFRRPGARMRVLQAGRALRRWWRREPAGSGEEK